MRRVLARFRVPLGFLCAAAGFWLARPSLDSFAYGAAIASLGEGLRIWAAGHIEKGREITRSGPYRFVRHPLYLGSSIMGLGFIVAARSLTVAILVVAYLGLTLLAAMRTEEAVLDEQFSGQYSAYRAGTAPAVDRAFSVARMLANREYRAMLGLGLGMLVLYLRARSML